MIKQPSCGFGAPISSFYKNVENTALTPEIKNCLGNSIYGPKDASYNLGYPPDILRPPWGYNPTSFGKSLNVLKRELKYLLKLNE